MASRAPHATSSASAMPARALLTPVTVETISTYDPSAARESRLRRGVIPGLGRRDQMARVPDLRLRLLGWSLRGPQRDDQRARQQQHPRHGLPADAQTTVQGRYQ